MTSGRVSLGICTDTMPEHVIVTIKPYIFRFHEIPVKPIPGADCERLVRGRVFLNRCTCLEVLRNS